VKFLKSLALGLFSFLLFPSLAIFGLLYMLDNTLLKPDFLISEMDSLDVPSLAGELFSIQTPQGIPYLDEAIDETIADLEPWMKL